MIQKQIIHISQKSGQDIASGYEDNPCHDYFDKKPEICNETIEFDLVIFDESILFRIDIEPKMIKLSEVVSLAYEISSNISSIVQSKYFNKGKTIPCKKGCSACCNYLVPLSIPEAFYLRNLVIALPEDRRKTIFNSFLESAKSILHTESKDLNLMTLQQLSKWYFEQNLSCPFLSNNTCSIYEERPIACREYLVTGSPSLCNPAQEKHPQKTYLPVSITECLAKLSAELKHSEIEAIMMPLALLWAEDNLDGDMETWPSIELVSRLCEIIKETIEINYSVPLN